jgi:micrococcal nuclease
MKLIVTLLFFGMLMQPMAFARSLQGIVTRVSDGDTFWMATDPKSKPFKVRLHGVDAPELCQAGGKAARDALRARLLRQSVNLETLARDDYQRTIARVDHQGINISAWLVSQGHAWSDQNRYGRGPYDDEEDRAKKQRVGLWAQSPPPISPKQFRKIHGACKL